MSTMLRLPLLLLAFSGFVTGTLTGIPRLNPSRGGVKWMPKAVTESAPKEFQTFYYMQTIDHFNYKPESYATFRQKYVINFKYWGGANASAPIFAYLGAEQPLDDSILTGIGFLSENAAQFNALLIYMEHRYYGSSIPFGSFRKAQEKNVLGYFSSAQALADYAEILIYLQEKLNAQYSPVIVVGASYGGDLAAWFRLKYPHVSLGALASSAPLLYFDHLTPDGAYYSVVTKDFRETSETCYQTIRDSWSEIYKLASEQNGLSILSKTFHTCFPLNDASDLRDQLLYVYGESAQYDQQPPSRVATVCSAIDGVAFGTDILSKIFAGVVAFVEITSDNTVFANIGNRSCFINPPYKPDDSDLGWDWQTCSELVMPQPIVQNNSMLPPVPFNLKSYMEQCRKKYGVFPRPNWITSYYGGHDIKLILERFGSNIIFSNGLRDPYSSGGVLENISDTILAVYTVNGSHALDVLTAQPSDPQWLVEQRKMEVRIIEDWIKNYYADLHAYKH